MNEFLNVASAVIGMSLKIPSFLSILIGPSIKEGLCMKFHRVFITLCKKFHKHSLQKYQSRVQ